MYSRDALAGPLRELEKVLLSIRQQQFNPDASRSGRFSEVCKIEDNEPNDCCAAPESLQVAEVGKLELFEEDESLISQASKFLFSQTFG